LLLKSPLVEFSWKVADPDLGTWYSVWIRNFCSPPYHLLWRRMKISDTKMLMWLY